MPESLRLAIVIPARNEEGNLAPLLAEIEAACAGIGPFEVIAVDDGSDDGTAAALRGLAAQYPWLRRLSHENSGGKSEAIRNAVRVARAPIVATIDGDGQNDPRFIPIMLAKLDADPAVGHVQGQRIGRQDSGFKKFQSRIANRVRARILHDGTRDTGCGQTMFRREVYLALPFFDGLHRFMPALARREGWGVAHVDVVDRARRSGVSNYGMSNRLWVGLFDLFGVWWLIRRRKRPRRARETAP